MNMNIIKDTEKNMSGKMILGEDCFYNMDCYETQLNNNVLVVGSPGAGKTRSIVAPNILQATGSYVISDPKGNLYGKYAGYLKSRGYVVRKLDFTDPGKSAHFNFFEYIHNEQDVIRIASMIALQESCISNDPFWDYTTQILLQALISYLHNYMEKDSRTYHNLLELARMKEVFENDDTYVSTLDKAFRLVEQQDENSSAVRYYKMFNCAAGKTLKSILISMFAKLGPMDTDEMNEMTGTDDLEIGNIGKQKTALFVIVSDTDRSMDMYANLFYTIALRELCRVADEECKNQRLPIPVRFILDDFATNVKINDFPRMIASFRSRNISTMLIIQAEAQLTACYGEDAETIKGSCDTYVYLGTNDVPTAQAVALKCDVPLKKILYMPIGTNVIFRRGQFPYYGKNFVLESHPAFRTMQNRDLCQ